MSKKYISNDYTLKILEQNQKETAVSEVEVKKYVLFESYFTGSWNSDGQIFDRENSKRTYDIISGNTDLNSSLVVGQLSFGYGAVIDGNIMAVGNQLESRNKTLATCNGVFVFRSGSIPGAMHIADTGWRVDGFCIPAESDFPQYQSPGVGNNSSHDIEHGAQSFDLDGTTIVICAPANMSVDQGRPAGTQSGKVFVYESGSSSGWVKTKTITTGSLSVSAKSLVDTGYSFGRCAKVSGDRIVVGTVVSAAPFKKHLFTFKSSSTNSWEFESTLTAGYEKADGVQDRGVGSYSVESNLHLDITNNGTRIIVGGMGETTNISDGIPIPGEFGCIVIWDYYDSAWNLDPNQLTLQEAGLNGNVSTATYGTNYDKEYKLYTQLGRNSCAASGSYIAATAMGRTVGSPVQRLPSRLFIFKSSSTAGWEPEANFKSPNPDTEGLNSATHDDRFGNSITLNQGTIAVSAPQARKVSGNTKAFGKINIYSSSSITGWSLKQTVDNPYVNSNSTVAGGFEHLDRRRFGGPVNNWSTDFGKVSSYVGLSDKNLAIPWQDLRYDESEAGAPGVQFDDRIAGGLYVITGSFNKDSENTRIISTYNPTPLPFRFSVNGMQNIKLQSGSAAVKTFIGDQRS